MPDLVVVGSGMAGLTAALFARERGADPVVLERSESLGGTAAYSGGQVWVAANHVAARGEDPEDGLEAALTYVRDIGREHPELLDPAVARHWLEQARRVARDLEELKAVRWEVIPGYPDYYYPEAAGSRSSGRYLTPAPFEGARLGGLRPLLQPAPHFPSGITYAEMFSWGGLSSRTTWDYGLLEQRRQQDVLTFGHALAAGLLAAAADRGVPLERSTTVVGLLEEDGTVVGVRCRRSDGEELTVSGPVLFAAGGYDWNADVAGELDGIPWQRGGSVAPPTIRGDALDLVRSVGGDVVHFPAAMAPRLPGYAVPGADGSVATYRHCMEHCLPHTFLVNRRGERFCDDSFHRAIVRAAVRQPDNLPMFMVWDAQHHEKYGLGPTMPGGSYPAGLVTTAATLAELATALGIDPAGLERSAERFNRHAREGIDPDHGRGSNRSVQRFRGDGNHRPNPNLGPVGEAPFFGMELRLLGTGISATGIRTDAAARVCRADGVVVPGLYAAGASAAMTSSGSGYNSGFSLSRAMTFGALAAEHVTDSPR